MSYIDTVNPNKYDNYDSYANVAAFPVAPTTIDRLFFAEDTSSYYRWDGAAYQLVVAGGGGGVVDSITAGTNIAVTGTADVPIVSTILNPLFSQVAVSAPVPLVANHLARKDYVDGQLTNYVQTVSAAPSDFIIVDNGDPQNPQIDLEPANINRNLFSGILTTANGGTGTGTLPPTNGQLFIGNISGNYTVANLTAGTNISITNGSGSITIDATGESNTASNVNVGGVGVFKQKTLADLEFRGVNAASSKISVALDAVNNEIDVDVVEANIPILGLLGAPASAVVGISDVQTLSNKTLGTDLNAGTFKITNLGVPSSATDSATKGYVDSVAAGLDVKQSVRVATLVAGTLASSFENGDVIDGYTLQTGDRILIKNQASAIENGIYTVNASGAPTRASDYLAGSSAAGTFTFIEGGSTQNDQGWLCTANVGLDVVGTNLLPFTQFSNAGQYSFDDGLIQSGLSISVDRKTNGGLAIESAQLALSLGDSNITGVTRVVNGGTGQSTYTDGQLLIGNTTGNTLTKATLTAGPGITVTNGSGAITIGSSGGLYLSGAVIVDSSGNLTLNAVNQSSAGGVYSIVSNVLTIRADITIDGSLTMNSNSSLIVEGHLTVLGTFSQSTGSSIGTRGNMHIRGKSSSDTFVMASASIVSFDEFSVRNFSSSGAITHTSAGTALSITARSIVYDGNTARILFASGGVGFTLTADVIVFNANSWVGTGTTFTIHMHTTTLSAAVIRFTNNVNAATYNVVFQDAVVTATDIIDFNSNSITSGPGGACVYWGTSCTLNADKLSLNGNFSGSASASSWGVFLENTSTWICNIIELLNNYTVASGGLGVFINTTGVVKCDMLQVDLTTHNGSTRYANMTLTTASNLTRQYGTGRLLQHSIHNPNSATISGFFTASFLGVIPYASLTYEDFTNATLINLTTQNTYYALAPPVAGTLTTNVNPASIATIFTSPAAGQLRYTGVSICDLRLTFHISLFVSTAADRYRLYFFKNGVTVGNGHAIRMNSNNIVEGLTHQIVVNGVVTNDLFQVYMTDVDANNRNVCIQSFQLQAQRLTVQ
ncbi:MAG: hypothetical protein ABWZ79_05910 [Pedobacter agri]